jgi:hypothetical protein
MKVFFVNVLRSIRKIRCMEFSQIESVLERQETHFVRHPLRYFDQNTQVLFSEGAAPRKVAALQLWM